MSSIMPSTDSVWSQPFETLRKKWKTVPSGLVTRETTSDLAARSDDELLAFWSSQHEQFTTGEDGFATRGWYHELYKDVFRGEKVMDLGSGLGFDGITYAKHGAKVTFVDIVASNLELIERLCRIMGVGGCSFHYMEDISSLESLDNDYDVVWAQGSLINAPFDVTRNEIQHLLRHLKIGGRWVELAYPRERWEREGSLPFEQWGEKTDGAGTPYVEWYDLEKLQKALEPAAFEVIFSFNFHNDDYNWFDLIRRG